jgi:MoxR-like ATPase
MPHQTDPSGKGVITDLNVQADKAVRSAYPIGTVFASETLEIRTGSLTPFYAAGNIFPVSVGRGDLADTNHAPISEMVEAYNAYMANHGAEIHQGSTRVSPAGARTLLDKIRSNPRFAVPTVDQDGFWVGEDNWYLLLVNLLQQENTLFTGPSGVGKTELVLTACRKLGLKCHVYDMGSMYDPVSEMLGVHRIAPDGTSVFDYASFTKDIQEEGVILLDELSRATPAVNNILLPCLDSRRSLPVEMAGTRDRRSVPVHPKCRFVATANVGAEYTGTNVMDRALMDRFFPVELSYMPAEQEVAVLTGRYGIPKTDALNIVNAAAAVRSNHAKEELATTLSTRETLRAARIVAAGYTALRAMELTFLPLFEGTKAEGERSIVWNCILAN